MTDANLYRLREALAATETAIEARQKALRVLQAPCSELPRAQSLRWSPYRANSQVRPIRVPIAAPA